MISAFPYAEAGEVYQREDYVAFRYVRHPFHYVYVMGRDADGSYDTFFFIISEALPCSLARFPVGILPDFVEQEDVDDFQIHISESLLYREVHLLIGEIQGFRAYDRPLRRVLRHVHIS